MKNEDDQVDEYPRYVRLGPPILTVDFSKDVGVSKLNITIGFNAQYIYHKDIEKMIIEYLRTKFEGLEITKDTKEEVSKELDKLFDQWVSENMIVKSG
jgi:hypothetical protein